MMRLQRSWIAIFILSGSLILSVFAPSVASAQEAQVAAVDTVPPVISQPADLVVAAVNASGAAVSYLLPTAADATDGAVPVACLPAPGVVFPLGQSVVTC